VVAEGAGIGEVARLLADSGLVRSSVAFVGYWKFVNRGISIESGPYYLPVGKPMGQLAQVFEAGPNVLRFVIYRGSTTREISALAEQHLGISRQDMERAISDRQLMRLVRARGPSLEGYLLPGVYYVNRNASAEDLVRQFVETFLDRWKDEWSLKAFQMGFSRDEVVTLASIIEGEIVLPEERDTVSSVYHNRLANDMPLQADPTVVYALGERRRLLNQDYRIDSPYNTYRNKGLPPGPIGQPTLASIEAALFPAQTAFYYFVAADGSQHVFSETYEQHLSTIDELRQPSNETLVTPESK